MPARDEIRRDRTCGGCDVNEIFTVVERTLRESQVWIQVISQGLNYRVVHDEAYSVGQLDCPAVGDDAALQ